MGLDPGSQGLASLRDPESEFGAGWDDLLALHHHFSERVLGVVSLTGKGIRIDRPGPGIVRLIAGRPDEDNATGKR